MRLLSSRQYQEVSGYILGFGSIFLLTLVLYGVSNLEVPEPAKPGIAILTIGFIVLVLYQMRSFIVHQPSKSYAHVAQCFSDETNPWEIHGVVRKIEQLDPKDPLYAESMKPFALENQYAYVVDYKHITVLGEAPFEFKTALLFGNIDKAELKATTEHEILYKGFPANVGCVFLVLDLLTVHKVEAVKGVRDEEWIPVFYVRHAPVHSQFQKKFAELPQARIEMLNTKELVATVSLVSVKDRVIKLATDAREEGVKMGEDLGAEQIRRYKRVGEPGFSIPSPRSHKKAYAVLGVLSLFLVVGYFLGWLRIG